MKMNGKNPKVDWYFEKAEKWKSESVKLRTIILDCGLTEELRWGKPCYAFKEYCAVLFMKGALLKDPKKILVQQTENVQAARQIRFTNIREIIKLEPVL